MTPLLARLEEITGHKFEDIALLERAVTHRSWAYENLPDATEEKVREAQNETLEFVGDSVLGLVVAELLFSSRPGSSEGDLTMMKHRLVSTATLGKIAERLGLGEFIRVGRGEEKTGGRKKQALLANTLEAVIGAVFADGGYIKARHFISTTFSQELKEATPGNSVDYKSMLQEVLQSDGRPAPVYTVVRTDGPPHERIFNVEAAWEGGKSSGSGNSIKAAEMKAAEEALASVNGGKGKGTKRSGKK